MHINEILAKISLDESSLLKQINGGNSLVLKVKQKDESLAAVKIYRGSTARITQMFSRELDAITFLRNHDFTNVPEILDTKPELSLIIFKWFDGLAPINDFYGIDLITKMCVNLNILHKKFSYHDYAIDYVFSSQDILDQIQNRLNGLLGHFKPEIGLALRNKFDFNLYMYKLKYPLNHQFTSMTLNISDIGTHNMLVSNDQHIFIDFEFFGQDSIDKMVGDFLLHPKNDFSSSSISYFIDNLTKNSTWDISTLVPLLPLLSLKWSLIAFKRLIKEGLIQGDARLEGDIFKNSLGAKYLLFFDYLLNSTLNRNLLTFNQFNGTV